MKVSRDIAQTSFNAGRALQFAAHQEKLPKWLADDKVSVGSIVNTAEEKMSSWEVSVSTIEGHPRQRDHIQTDFYIPWRKEWGPVSLRVERTFRHEKPPLISFQILHNGEVVYETQPFTRNPQARRFTPALLRPLWMEPRKWFNLYTPVVEARKKAMSDLQRKAMAEEDAGLFGVFHMALEKAGEYSLYERFVTGQRLVK